MRDRVAQFYEGWKNYSFPNKETEFLSNKRMKICKQCEYFTPKGRCRKCGCFMVAKSRSKRARCPLRLW